VNRYEIVRRLATGGMAEVLLARDETGRLVALKRVLPHLAQVTHVVDRLRVEARATAALDHPGIVRAIELLEDEGPTLVLEHVAGVDARTLRARARAAGRELPPVVVASIVSAAASALAHAHARGVVHRDLRAANLLLAWDGTVKLADFGIAAVGEPADPADDVTALTHLAARLSAPHDKDPPSPAAAEGGFSGDIFSEPAAPALSAPHDKDPPSPAAAEGGFSGQVFADPPPSAVGLALRLERWLADHGVDDPRAPVAALLAELFSDDERRDSVTVDDDFGDPTPPLLGR